MATALFPEPFASCVDNDSGFLNVGVDRVARGDVALLARTGGILKFCEGSPFWLLISGSGTFIGILNPFVAFACL